MKKSLSIILATVLILSLFTGCDKNKTVDKVESDMQLTSEYENSTELVGNPNATGELNIMLWGDEPREKQLDMFCVAAEKFKQLYPKVIVNINRVSHDTQYKKYSEDLWTSVNNRTGPDLFFSYPNEKAYEAIKNGSVADMSEYFEKDDSFQPEEYNQAVLYGDDPNGKQFFVPLGYTMPLLISTKSVLEQSKFDVNQCTDFFTTTKELYNLAMKPAAEKPLSRLFWSYFPTEIGLDYINYDAQTVSLSSNQIKECAQQLSKLNDYCATDNYDDEWIGKLKQKKTVIVQLRNNLHDPIDSYMSLCEKGEPVMFPWRNANGNIQARLWSNNVMVSKSSKNKQNAYYFIKVLLSKDVQLLSEYGGSYKQYIPVSNNALKEYLNTKLLSEDTLNIYSDKKKAEKDATIFINEFIDFTTQVDGVESNSPISDIYYNAMSPFYENKKSYEDCVKDAERKIQAYLFG